MGDIIKEVEVKAEPEGSKKGVVVYTGEYGLVDKLARRIPKIGNEYEPVDEMQVAELEYQVKQFRVTKEVF